MVLPLQPSMLENSFSSTERDNDQDQQPVSPQQQQNSEKLAAVQHVSVADSFPFPHSQQHSHISLFPFAKPQHAHQHHNHVDLKIHIPISSSSQFIPTSSSSDSTPDPSPPSSLSSSASRSDYLPHSTSYSDLTPLPSPLVPADSTAAIFKAFNGQSPPSTAISRAPSVRTKGFRYVGPSASRQHKHTQTSSSTAALMMAASMGKNPSISPSLSARMDDDNPISHLHLNDHTNAYRQHNEDYFSHTQYPDSKSTLKNIFYNSTVNEVQQPNQHHLLSSPLINSSQDNATNNRVFPNHYLASTPEENTEVYSHNQSSKSVSPRHSKYNNSRSISEYVPQPINFMKYQLPVLSPSPRSQRQRPVPPPSSSDTITVEKRKTPSKSHDQQSINSMNDGPQNGDEKNSQFVAPVSTNITPEDSTIVGSPSTPTPKVQPRSLSSGSSAHGQKIHREAHTTTSSPVSSKKSISKLPAVPHMDPVASNIGSGISGLFKNHSNKDLASENTKPIDESSRVSSTVTLTPTATEYSVNNDFPNSSTPTPQPPSVDKNSLSTTSLNSSISDKNINISNISNSSGSSSSLISGNTGKVENIRVANSSSGSISITSNSSNNYTSSPSILSKSTSSPTSTNFSSPISSPSAQYYFSATNNSSQFSQPSTTTASTSSLNNATIPVSPSSGNNSILQDGTLPRSKPSSATNLLNSGNSTEENHSLIINGLAGNNSILSTSDANNAENVTFSEPLVTLTPTPVTHNRDIVAEAAKITTNIESQNNHGFVVSATNDAYDVTCDDPSSIKSSSTSSTSSTSSGSIQSTTSTTTSSSSVIHTSAADVSSKATVAPSTQVEKDEDANMSNTTLVVEDTSMEDVETEIKYPERVYEAYDINMKKSTWNEIEKLGSGAFSRVLLACPADRYLKPEYQGRSMDYKVAIKVVDMQGTAHEEDTYTRGHRRTESAHHHKHSRERMESGLKREIEILKKLFHPSLIRMYAFNIDSKSALMILPLCRGGDLFELISKHRSEMSCALIRRIFGEICRAVCYLHKNNVVHRDIKLENVLLNLPVEEMLRLSGVNGSIDEERSRLEVENYPKAMATLTDMGLSREIDPEDPLLSTRCGSVDYVPPELLMGQTYDGRQTDSWALGVLLYAMMEGRLPFDPPINSNGKAVRGKVTHRIAKVEWSWVAFQDHEEEFERDGKTEEDAATDWMGGIWIVEGALRRRDARLLTTEMVEQPWVKGCAPEKLEYAWMMDINEIFK